MVQNFYEHEAFVGERGKLIQEVVTPWKGEIHSPASKSYFEEMHQPPQFDPFDRYGVLQGEYLCLQGHFLIRRDLQVTTINLDLFNQEKRDLMEQGCTSPVFQRLSSLMVEKWNEFPLAEGIAVLADMNCDNYYHLTVDILPRFRFIDRTRVSEVWMVQNSPITTVQRDLFDRLSEDRVGNQRIQFPQTEFRVKNPFLVHAVGTQEGIEWLRKTVNLTVPPGNKRYYIHRQPSADRTKAERELAQTSELQSILKEFDFQSVEFSSDTKVSDQLKKLEGAGIIVSVHGSNLTNIVYLAPPLVVIEIIGEKFLQRPYFFFRYYLRLSQLLGFKYHAIISDRYDADGRIVVDGEVLRGILRRYL